MADAGPPRCRPVGGGGLLQQLALLDEGARQLFYLATHDRLTGLANRWLLEERLAHAVARSRRGNGRGALLFIDLDDFKSINDRHGHEVGDRMLVMAAERLVRVVRASDTVARWGGDEFAVLLEGIDQRDLAHAKGRELVQQLAEPCETVPDGGAVARERRRRAVPGRRRGCGQPDGPGRPPHVPGQGPPRALVGVPPELSRLRRAVEQRAVADRPSAPAGLPAEAG